jgi:hypothetical protein
LERTLENNKKQAVQRAESKICRITPVKLFYSLANLNVRYSVIVDKKTA